MIFDDVCGCIITYYCVWWCMLMYVGICWCMLYDDVRWLMMVYGEVW